MSLKAFLSANATAVENRKVVISDRFREGGMAVLWEIRAISEAENETLRRGCTRQVKTKRGEMEKTDNNLYIGKLAVESVVYPDLKDAELQNSYGVMGADSLLKAMLTAGEYAALLNQVQEINGFDKDMNELVGEAKN
ncbi:MAG: Phage XkdN-like protein [Oscillospiraceae bacterium]|nr:Phage XkdN-like protein [Oscillospiraceae bacterium]